MTESAQYDNKKWKESDNSKPLKAAKHFSCEVTHSCL